MEGSVEGALQNTHQNIQLFDEVVAAKKAELKERKEKKNKKQMTGGTYCMMNTNN